MTFANEAPSSATVSIIVPTKNSARTLEACLESIRRQSHLSELVVVDNRSADDTERIARRWADLFFEFGPERSAQRNAGAKASNGAFIGFIDSDMVLSPHVVAEAVQALGKGAAAVIVPERTVGKGYWANVRTFERAFYLGEDGVEAARFFRRDAFEVVGGFDERLNAGEDWDLTLRVRAIGSVERISSVIEHDEGRVGYIAACRKKGAYAEGLLLYHRKHGWRSLARLIDRPYLRKPWLLCSPLGLGVVFLKLGETTSAVLTLAAHRWKRDR